MVGDLITLPLQLSVRATERMLHVGMTVSGRALNLAAGVVKTLTGTATDGAYEQPPPAREQPRQRSAREPAPAAEPGAQAGSPEAQPAPPPSPPEPPHVSEEPVLIEELAEPGAEDGAGATIEVDQPWEDYDQMSAKDIAGRVRKLGAAELAVVELYESTHRSRETVLAAVKRALKSADRDGPTT